MFLYQVDKVSWGSRQPNQKQGPPLPLLAALAAAALAAAAATAALLAAGDVAARIQQFAGGVVDMREAGRAQEDAAIPAEDARPCN